MANSPAKKSAAKGSKGSPKKAAKPRAKKPAAPPADPPQQPDAPVLADAGDEGEAGAPILHGDESPIQPAFDETIRHPVPEPADDDEEAESLQPAAAPEGDWAAKVTAARSAPIHYDNDATTLVGQAIEEEATGMDTAADDAPLEVTLDEAEAEQPTRRAPAVAQATGDLTIPEQFITIAIEGQWDDRMERVKPGRMGAALAGSVLLELAVLGKLKVQRDHFVVEEGSTGDADLDGFAEQVQELGPIPTEQVVRRLGRRLTDRIRPWKARAERRGWLREERRKFLGVLPRSTTILLDEEVQGKLQNRLVRMLAGGGNPDVKTIALLGLIQSAGLLGQMVPSSALAFNERRISLLLSGRDPLHYRVDTSVRQVQDLALRTILGDVRKLR
jgi:hypothetical protein